MQRSCEILESGGAIEEVARFLGIPKNAHDTSRIVDFIVKRGTYHFVIGCVCYYPYLPLKLIAWQLL